ncbi:XRE family transcriptional regulator [bacterium]|nr:MAG: XRE family transcriptional regulator [bacterium]
MSAPSSIESPGRASPKTIGDRIQHYRHIRNLTREETAARAGISRTTLLRLERGLPAHESTIRKVAKALQVYPPHLFLPDEEWNRPYQVHRADDNPWYPTAKLKERPGQIEPDIQSADERNRLGHLGYFGAFVRPITIVLRDADLGVGVAEFYANYHKLMRHPGLEFLYITHGEVVVTIGEEEVLLKQGEAITFWGEVPHNYRPAHPVARGEAPPTCLMVVLEGATRTEM